MKEMLTKAKAAKAEITRLTTQQKNAALNAMADALIAQEAAILAANAMDLDAARGTVSDVMLDRLQLTSARIAGMAEGIRQVAALPDPIGNVVGGSTTGVAFHTANGTRRMYAFCEDYTGGDMLLRYDLGTADTWSTAPSATYSTVSGSLGHGNIEIVSCEKGIWVCQNYRGTASTADANCLPSPRT